MPALSSSDEDPLSLCRIPKSSAMQQRSPNFRRGDTFIVKDHADEVLKLHPLVGAALAKASLDASRQGQTQLALQDIAPQEIDDIEAPASNESFRALSASLLLCFYGVNAHLCDNASHLLEGSPNLLRCLHSLWLGANTPGSIVERAIASPSTSADNSEDPLHKARILAQLALRPISRKAKTRRASFDGFGALLTTLGERSLGMVEPSAQEKNQELKPPSTLTDETLARHALDQAHELSSISWASEHALTWLHKLPAVMHAKDEFLSAKESMLVTSECEHILSHGIQKWKSGAAVFRGEAERWRAALCTLILLTAGMRPGEFARIRMGVEAQLFPPRAVRITLGRLKRRGARRQFAARALGSSIDMAFEPPALFQGLDHYQNVIAPFLVASEGGEEKAPSVLLKAQKCSPSRANDKS